MILLQKAEKMSSEECGRILKNIREKYGSVEVPENTLEKCVRVYLALKEIIMQYDLDMISVKCIGEFMDSYTSCLSLIHISCIIVLACLFTSSMSVSGGCPRQEAAKGPYVSMYSFPSASH